MLENRIYIIRESVKQVTRILADMDIEVTQRGSNAFVEHHGNGKIKRVNIPHIPDNATEELIDAIQGFLDHEVGHLLFSDFDLLKKSADLGFGQEHNILEDPYVERKMQQRFRGSSQNLDNVRGFFLRKFTDPALAEALAKGDMARVQGILFVPAVRAWSGQDDMRRYMDEGDKWQYLKGFIAKIGEDLIERIGEISSTQDAFDIAKEMRERLKEKDEERMPPPPPGEGEKCDDGESSNSSGGEPSGGDSKDDASDDEPSESNGSSSGKDKGEESEEEPEKEQGDEGESGDDEDESDDASESDSDEEGDEESEQDSGSSGEEEDEDAKEEEDGGEQSDDTDFDDDPEEDGEDEGKGFGDDEDDDAGEEDAEDTDDNEDSDGDGGEDDLGDEAQADERDDDLVLSNAEREMDPDQSGDNGFSLEDWENAITDFDDGVSASISDDAKDMSADASYRVFSTEEDLIEVWNPRHLDDFSSVTRMEDEVDHMLGVLEKELERLIKARSMSRWQNGMRRGSLNSRSLARLAIGNRHPELMDDRVFRKKEHALTNDIAVQLVVDCSGSMSGRKMKTAMQAAYALASVLERIDVPHEVVGFTTKPLSHEMRDELYRETYASGVQYSRIESLYMPIFKSFGERFSPLVKKRFADWHNEGRLWNNIDGESVEVCYHRLQGRKEAGKLMIVLSDGAPACAGNSFEVRSHTKKVVSDIQKTDTNIIGIGIESSSVQHFYDQNVVLHSVDELPAVVIGKLKDILLASIHG